MTRRKEGVKPKAWTREKIDELSKLRKRRLSFSAIATWFNTSRSAIGSAVDRHLNADGSVRSYSSKPDLRYRRQRKNASVLDGHKEELSAASKSGLSSGKIAYELNLPRSTVANYMNYHGLYQRPATQKQTFYSSEKPISLPPVSIQRRNDFTEADVRAGMVDRAWAEREVAE